MPLPDERPRQSVANLIGRFEHQTKRPSASSPTPRSSSVISHTTGDSVKEEIRERREWPPQSLNDGSRNVGGAAKEEIREKREWPPRVSGVFTLPAADSVQDRPSQVKKPAVETSSSTGSKSSPQRSPLSRESSQSIPLVEGPPAQEAIEPVEKHAPKRQSTMDTKSPSAAASSNGHGTVSPKISASQSILGTSATKNIKSPVKLPAKLPPSSFSKSSSLQPIKQEARDRRTSASATPTNATPTQGRSQSSSRAAVRPKTPSTAASSQPKTPSTKPRAPALPPPRTPATATRPKTPSSAIVKSPSTGLYAPTAASLAKARNAQPPQPERKKTLSSSISLDRLSKPTAASLSKAKSPATILSTPQRKVMTPAKPRASVPARMKPQTTTAVGSLTGGAGEVAVGVLEAQGTVEVEHHENGHSSDSYDHEMLSDSATHPEIVLSDVEGHDHGGDEVLSPDEAESQHVAEEPEDLEVVEIAEEQLVNTHSATSEHGEGELKESLVIDEITITSPTESIDPASELHYADDEEEVTPIMESEPAKGPTHDIEEMVNLLEFSSFPSKISLDYPTHTEPTEQAKKNLKPEGVILDQAGEIPDEE